MKLRWKQVQAADSVIRTEAEKNEEENAPAGAEALLSEEYAVDETRIGNVLRGRSAEDVIRQSGGVWLCGLLIVQGISSSLGLIVVTGRFCSLVRINAQNTSSAPLEEALWLRRTALGRAASAGWDV